MFVMPKDDQEIVTIACPGVLMRRRVKRSALRTLGKSGWYVLDDDQAPVKPRKRTRKPAKKAVAEQVSEPTTGPVSGTEEE